MTITEAGTAPFLPGPKHQAFEESVWTDFRCLVPDLQLAVTSRSQQLIDVSGRQIGDGTPQIQKLVIARYLIGRDFTG